MKTKQELFKADAKQIVDTIFDNKLFKDNVTRDNMNGFEDLIQFLLESKYNSHIKMLELTSKIKEHEN